MWVKATNKWIQWAIVILATGLVFATQSSSPPAPARPNILLILADDLGWGDLGCYGNNTLRTPNIDQLAEDGARLTHALAAASLCTPSRAAILTGRYPIRMGLATSTGVRVIPFLAMSGGLLPTEVTFAKLAQEQGYATALIGKWHLGLHCSSPTDFCHHPLKHGFDYFYGLPWTNSRDIGDDGHAVDLARPFLRRGCLGIALSSLLTILWMIRRNQPLHLLCFMAFAGVFVPCVAWWVASSLKLLNGLVMRNFDFIEQPVRLEGLQHRFINESRKFIRANHQNGKPFLLVLAFNHVHTSLKPTPQFKGQSQHGVYGDSVEELDWAIGEVLKDLDHLGITNDTFVVFTSDQGAHLEEIAPDGSMHGGYNGPFKGGKGMGGMEGGFRIPALIRWPNHIAPRQQIHYPVSHMDLFPTIANLTGAPLPDNVDLDGRNILSLLTRDSDVPRDHVPTPRLLVHYCGVDVHAARWIVNETHVWKAFFASPIWLPNTTRCSYICPCRGVGVKWHHPPILYNIAQDPSEIRPIQNTSQEYKKIMQIIMQQLKMHDNGVQPVDNQLEFLNIVWYPWLQPCCKFPTCQCTEDVESTQ